MEFCPGGVFLAGKKEIRVYFDKNEKIQISWGILQKIAIKIKKRPRK